MTTKRSKTVPADITSAEARVLAALVRNRVEDDMMLLLNPQVTRQQLIRERFNRNVDEFLAKTS